MRAEPDNLPIITAESPFLVKVDGKCYVSSYGLAQVMRRDHAGLIAAIAGLDLSPAFRAVNFRPAYLKSGGRVAGLWISETGFEVLALTFPNAERQHWKRVLLESFRVLAQGGLPLAEAA